jgi:hypothetical protein
MAAEADGTGPVGPAIIRRPTSHRDSDYDGSYCVLTTQPTEVLQLTTPVWGAKALDRPRREASSALKDQAYLISINMSAGISLSHDPVTANVGYGEEIN